MLSLHDLIHATMIGTTARDGGVELYWRLRYGGSQQGADWHTLLERLCVLDLKWGPA